MSTIIENISIALGHPDDYTARAHLMWSATLALNGLIGMGVPNGGDWATHSIEHELSAWYDIPHAAGLAILTPRWMRVIRDERLTKLAQYGRRVWSATGSTSAAADHAIDRTEEFFGSLGIPMRLSDWGIDRTHFDTMVERLVARRIGEHPLTAEQIREVLESSL